MREDLMVSAGGWWVRKWQTRLDETGGDYISVAKQLRKQGVPLEVALMLLCGRGVK